MAKGHLKERYIFPILILLQMMGGTSCTYTPSCTEPPDDLLINPVGLALSPDGRYLYVTNANASLRFCSGFLSRIDLGTTPYKSTIAFKPGRGDNMSYLGGLVFSPDGSLLFAASREGNEVVALTVTDSSLSVAARIPVGKGPFAIAYFSPTSQVLVTNLSSNDVSIVDGNGFTEVARVPLSRGLTGSRPSGIAVSPTTGPLSHNYAFVTQQLSPYVSVVDLSLYCEFNPLVPATVSTPVFQDAGAASNPTMSDIALQQCSTASQQWSATFTTGTGGKGHYTVFGTVSGVQPNTADEGVQYSSASGGVSFTIFGGSLSTTPGDSFTFATTRRSGIMSVLGNTSEGYTRGIAVFPDGTRAAIASRGLRGLVLADLMTNSFVDVISVCDTPEDVAVSPDGKMVYMTCLTSNAFYQVDPLTRQIVNVVPTDLRPSTIVISKDGTKAYVANYQSNTIDVIDLQTMSISGRIP